jgi:hypothetical protein
MTDGSRAWTLKVILSFWFLGNLISRTGVAELYKILDSNTRLIALDLSANPGWNDDIQREI